MGLVEPVQDFTYLGSIQTSNRNSSSECRPTRRIGLAAGAMKHLDRIWNQPNLMHHANENSYILHMRAGSSPLWLRNLDPYTSRLETIGHGVSGGYFTPDGTISYLTTKSYAGPVSWQPLPSFTNEDSDCLVMLPDSQRTFQQTRSFGLAAKPKTVPDHLLIGNVLVVDLPLPGSIRSAGTQEYQ